MTSRKASIWFVPIMMISSRWSVGPVRSLSTASTSLSSLLQNPSLLPAGNRNRPTFEVRNPADPDSVVGNVMDLSSEELYRKISRTSSLVEGRNHSHGTSKALDRMGKINPR